MQTQLNKLNSDARKRAEQSRNVNSSSEASIQSMDPDAQLLIGDIPQPSFRREEEAVDVVFRGILSRSNLELQKLLRDLRRRPQVVGVHRSAHNRQVSELLIRAVRCAAKQYKLQAKLGNFALKDELTGLYNRRGFQALAERQLKLGRRSGRGMLLFFIDVDGLKGINDTYGHTEGDQVLKHMAETLKKTFRDSDILARLGGDEFVVLAVEALDHSEATIMARLRRHLKTINAAQTEYAVSASVGVARFDHSNPTSIRKLLVRADQAMYEQKRCRSSAGVVGEADYLC